MLFYDLKEFLCKDPKVVETYLLVHDGNLNKRAYLFKFYELAVLLPLLNAFKSKKMNKSESITSITFTIGRRSSVMFLALLLSWLASPAFSFSE